MRWRAPSLLVTTMLCPIAAAMPRHSSSSVTNLKSSWRKAVHRRHAHLHREHAAEHRLVEERQHAPGLHGLKLRGEHASSLSLHAVLDDKQALAVDETPYSCTSPAAGTGRYAKLFITAIMRRPQL